MSIGRVPDRSQQLKDLANLTQETGRLVQSGNTFQNKGFFKQIFIRRQTRDTTNTELRRLFEKHEGVLAQLNAHIHERGTKSVRSKIIAKLAGEVIKAEAKQAEMNRAEPAIRPDQDVLEQLNLLSNDLNNDIAVHNEYRRISRMNSREIDGLLEALKHEVDLNDGERDTLRYAENRSDQYAQIVGRFKTALLQNYGLTEEDTCVKELGKISEVPRIGPHESLGHTRNLHGLEQALKKNKFARIPELIGAFNKERGRFKADLYRDILTNDFTRQQSKETENKLLDVLADRYQDVINRIAAHDNAHDN